jgi:hypothetical protein
MILFTISVLIIATVQSFYTLRPRTHFIDRALQLYGQTFLAVVSSLPILIVLLALAIPRRSQPDTFGAGKMSVKIAILLAGASLVTIGAWYRCGTSWATPVPRSHPLPVYLAKPCFYIFNFVVELLTVYLYAIMRVDQRFHVPNGAKGPGSYASLKNVSDDEGMTALRDGPEMSLREPASAHVVTSTVILRDTQYQTLTHHLPRIWRFCRHVLECCKDAPYLSLYLAQHAATRLTPRLFLVFFMLDEQIDCTTVCSNHD